MAKAGDQVILLVDKGSDQLGGVHLSRTHGHKLLALMSQLLFDQFFGVIDDTHGSNGEHPQMGAHQ